MTDNDNARSSCVPENFVPFKVLDFFVDDDVKCDQIRSACINVFQVRVLPQKGNREQTPLSHIPGSPCRFGNSKHIRISTSTTEA